MTSWRSAERTRAPLARRISFGESILAVEAPIEEALSTKFSTHDTTRHWGRSQGSSHVPVLGLAAVRGAPEISLCTVLTRALNNLQYKHVNNGANLS